MRMRWGVALTLLAGLGACGREAGPPTVAVADARCRPVAAGAPVAGCYLTLTASGDDRLVSVETTLSDRTEIHTMSMDGGIMRMRKLGEGLALPAGQAVALMPGAEHLMLFAPKAALAEGSSVPLTLRFERAAPLAVTAAVRP